MTVGAWIEGKLMTLTARATIILATGSQWTSIAMINWGFPGSPGFGLEAFDCHQRIGRTTLILEN